MSMMEQKSNLEGGRGGTKRGSSFHRQELPGRISPRRISQTIPLQLRLLDRPWKVVVWNRKGTKCSITQYL